MRRMFSEKEVDRFQCCSQCKNEDSGDMSVGVFPGCGNELYFTWQERDELPEEEITAELTICYEQPSHCLGFEPKEHYDVYVHLVKLAEAGGRHADNQES